MIAALAGVVATASAQTAGSFSAPTAISDPAQTAPPFDLKLVARDDGHALAAWMTNGSVAGAYRPTAIGGALQPFGAATIFESGTGLSEVDVGMNASSVARAAWAKNTGVAGPDRYRIRVSSKVNNGSAFGAATTVADGDKSDVANPLVRVGASGQGVLVYSWPGTLILSGGFYGNRYEGQYSAPGAAFPGEASASPAILPDGANDNAKLAVDDAGGAMLTAYSSYCCNQRTIVNNARSAGDAGAWGTKTTTASGDGNDNGCLCNTPGNVNSVVLPGGVVGWSYGRKASFGTSLFYVQATGAAAGSNSPPASFNPLTYELTGGVNGYGLRIERDPAGNLLAAWFTGSGATTQIVTRYKPEGTAFDAWQAAQSTPAPSAADLDLAADGAGNFWMTYSEGTGATQTVQVVERQKATGALGAATTVSDTVGSAAQLPEIAADADGYVTVVWRDGDPALADQSRVFSATFTPTPPVVDPGPGPGPGPTPPVASVPTPGGSTPPVVALPGVPRPPLGGLPEPKSPAKLTVERAGIKNGRLDVLARITARATGEIKVIYQANGKTLKFAADIPEKGGSVKISRKLTEELRRGGTGILTLVYNGNAAVRADDVRLRAANRKANLTRKVAKISKGRLRVSGTISTKARGVVRVRFTYLDVGDRVEVKNYSGKITKGTWSINQKVPSSAETGGGQLSIQFTGYRRGKIRGEQDAKAVKGSG